MDDGKCLLDVISDPQALKEFFRSSSQIAFVEGKVPSPAAEIKTEQNNASKDTSQHTTFTTSNSQTSSSQQQKKQLEHFSFGNSLGDFPTNSPSKNGLQTSSVTNSRNVNTPISSQVVGTSNLSANSPATLGQTIQNSSSVFSNTGNPRNLLSSGSASLSVPEKPISVPSKENTTQPRPLSNPVVKNTVQNIRNSPLPILRPKGMVPKPQNATSSLSGTSQVTIHGNVLTQSLKTTPVKAQQQLVTIRPKLVIAQPNPTGLTNSNPRPKQAAQSPFTLGAQPKPRANSSSMVPQPGAQSVGKSSLASLVQLQPKQIAPKPDSGKMKLGQEQAHLQLVQSLLLQGQAQLGSNTTSTGEQKSILMPQSQFQSNVIVPKDIEQQNHLKKLLEQNQVMQQTLQAQQQQNPQPHTQQLNVQQQQQQQIQQQLRHNQLGQQQQQASQQSRVQLLQMNTTTSAQQQSNILQPTIASNFVQVNQQQKPISNQTILNPASLAIQLKEAINNKQLHQFLEKNPVVAQQLKQLNMRQGLNAKPVTSAITTSVKGGTQLQKPVVTIPQKPNQTLQHSVGVTLSKSTLLQNPTITIGQSQKPVLNQLQRPVVTQLQKPVSSVAHLQKPVTQLVKPGGTVVSQVTTTVGKTDQKPVTTQKVVIVQQSGSPAVNMTQTKVLLQTKEGRPILLSQEQFKQIQAQLASKNLSIQGKLVTAATTTTANLVKPQVVVKADTSTPSKANQKVLPATAKPQVKQDATKGSKRPIKIAETEESKLIKRMKLTVQKDQNDVCAADIHKPFKTHQDAIKRLTPYHVYSEPIPNRRMRHKANYVLNKLALQLTHKSDKLINKYRNLLLSDMQRDVPSAEVVMVNRIFLADEKAALLKNKKAAIEEAKVMAQSARATVAQTKEPEATKLPTTTTAISQKPEPAHIEISDDDSSPMTSANSFLSHVTDDSLVNKKLDPG